MRYPDRSCSQMMVALLMCTAVLHLTPRPLSPARVAYICGAVSARAEVQCPLPLLQPPPFLPREAMGAVGGWQGAQKGPRVHCRVEGGGCGGRGGAGAAAAMSKTKWPGLRPPGLHPP